MISAALDLTEFKTAWRVLLLAMIGVAISANAALLYSFGTLVVPLEKEFGWTRGEVQSSVTALYLGAIVGLQIAGWTNTKYGIRRVTLASLILISAAYLMITLIVPISRSIWVFYGLIALLPIFGAGTLTLTWTELIAVWFKKNRGLALAIGLSGTGLAAAILPPVMAYSIERWDWRVVFLILCALNVGLALPLSVAWIPRTNRPTFQSASALPLKQPAFTEKGWSYRSAMASRQFWTLNLALSVVVSAIIAMATSAVPLFESRGIEPLEAAAMFSSFGAALITGRIAVGYGLDRIWPAGIASFALFLPAIGCAFILWGGTTPVILVVGAFLIGFGAGAEFDMAAFLVSRYFGLREYARLFGFHLGLATAAAAFGPLLVGYLVEETGGYTTTVIYSMCCFATGSALLLTLGAPRDVEDVESDL